MNDTFLVTHQISALRFSIGGLLSPISIRDQMVRAKMFVDRAIDEHLISARRGLFVVGAGAAGVTAAMYAASMGFPVTLIDRRERPFHLQRECHTRWIDPTQYDWPASHWNEGIFPWDSNMWDAEAAPLRWAADLAYNVAAGWHQELDLAVQDYKGILEYLPLMKYIGTDDPAPGHELKVLFRNIVDGENELSIAEEREVCPGFDSEALTGEKPLLTRQCGALLDARGFPREKVQCGSYRSFAFWDSDPFEQRTFELNIVQQRLRVLICGSGDGALQDFLRISTGMSSAAAIMATLEPLIDQVDKHLLRRIYSEEDQLYRAKIWSGKKYDHHCLLRMDFQHKIWTNEILASTIGAEIRQKISGLLNYSSNIDLDLVHTCDHFTAHYPLNRFLVHLISTVDKDRIAICNRGGKIDIRPRLALSKISCVDHTCESPRECLGKPHAVDFEPLGDCCSQEEKDKDDTSQLVRADYDVVILRLGLEHYDSIESTRQLQFHRHLLPYHPPL